MNPRPFERGPGRLLTRERVQRVSVVVLAVNVALYVVLLVRGRFPFDAQGTIVLPDFMAHLTGGALVLGGRARELYSVAAQSVFQVGITHEPATIDVFLSPPLTACLYAPFALLPYAGAAVAWTLASLGLLVLSGLFLRRLTASIARDDRRVFFIAFAASQPVIQLLGSGQDTAISLLLWCAGTYLALGRRDAAAGATFALGLFKPQLFLLPPLVFLALRRWRSFAAWLVVSFALAGVTLLVFGVSGVRGWLAILRSPEYLVSLQAGRALRMASVAPLVRSILPDAFATAADVVGKVLSLALALATVARCVGSGARGQVDERGVWALACVAALLVTPHLFYYDLALLALPAALILEMTGSYAANVRGALVALTLLTWTAAARIPFESAGWPLRLLAASWTAVPMFVLWWAIPTREIARTGLA